jgi:hypothetical protein
MPSHTVTRCCLRVHAEADPGVLARVIERFQNLNVTPQRFMAELGATGALYIQIEIVGMPDHLLTLIANKLRELPYVLNAYWHHA